MYEMTLTGLLNMCSSHYAKYEANYMIIEVTVGESAPEVIINPKENFELKAAYYANAYNEDLTLKANNRIRITRYDMVKEIGDYNW
jgi:hypothetical protein